MKMIYIARAWIYVYALESLRRIQIAGARFVFRRSEAETEKEKERRPFGTQ